MIQMNKNKFKLTQSIEDYLEVMYNLKMTKGVIRVSDIATELGVKPPSVVEAVDKISKLGLISQERYGEIKLNEEGIKVAKSILHKHNTLKSFLKILDVDEKTAEKEACAMEHILSDSTIRKLEKFTQILSAQGQHKDFEESFKQYKNRD